jgi:hypothetical protein
VKYTINGYVKNVCFGLVASFVLAQAARGQILTVQPARIVDLKQAVSKESGPFGVEPIDLAQAGGRWVVLTQSLGDSTILVAGDLTSTRVISVAGRFDRVRIDQTGRIYLRYLLSRKESQVSTRVLVLDGNGGPLDAATISEKGAEPVSLKGQIRWRTKAGVYDAHSVPANTGQAIAKDPNDELPQRVFSLGLPSGQYLTLGDLSEQVTLFGNDGRLLVSRKLDLKPAFDAASVRYKDHEAGSGETRVVWATTSADGLLYVYLSDTPASGPGYIGLFEPSTGKLVNVLRVLLPQAEGRRDATFNPQGYISPTFGAVGDHLVMVDKGMAIVAVY